MNLYHELRHDPSEHNVIFLMNLREALDHAELTRQEEKFVQLRYFEEPLTPVRNRINKVGGTSGTPIGSLTDEYVGQIMFPNVSFWGAKGRVKKTKASALRKISEALKEIYDNH